MPRIKRELISHLLEYEYFIEKASGVLIAFVFILLIVILPNWPIALQNYIGNPSALTLRDIGISTMITMLILISAATAYFIPHFDPTLRPHGFRAVTDRRMLNIYLALIASLLGIAVISYLIYVLILNL